MWHLHACMHQFSQGRHFSKVSSQKSNYTNVFSLAVVLFIGFKFRVQNGSKIRTIIANSVQYVLNVTCCYILLFFIYGLNFAYNILFNGRLHCDNMPCFSINELYIFLDNNSSLFNSFFY